LAISYLYEDKLNERDEGNYVCAIFIDLGLIQLITIFTAKARVLELGELHIPRNLIISY